MKYFDPERFTFYDDAIHTSIPTGCVAISDEDHLAAVEAMNSGKTVQVVDGSFVFTDVQETLVDAKIRKVHEINTAFQEADLKPVVVGGHAYKGGFESGLAIDAQRRAMVEYAIVNPLAGIVSVDFFDVTGAKVTLPLSSETEIDALDVCLALHQSASANAFKCAQLIAAARAATTIEAINAIKW